MRFAYLASGSKGNAALVEHGETTLLLDCGLNYRALGQRLLDLNKGPEEINAVLITHEHSDHVAGLAAFLKKHPIPVYTTVGTRRKLKADIAQWKKVNPEEAFNIGEIDIDPMLVPHDAQEPCQYRFRADKRRLGILTDLGHITPHITEKLKSCDALALECNHDVELLAQGPYPSFLKRRVGGQYGHLSNLQSLQLLERIDTDALQHFVGVHISQMNNDAQALQSDLVDVLSRPVSDITLAEQNAIVPWMNIE